MNEWKSLWNRRTVDASVLKDGSPEEILLELKRANGFDITSSRTPPQRTNLIGWFGFYEQFLQTKYELGANAKQRNLPIKSVFEVGCGSGANLYL